MKTQPTGNSPPKVPTIMIRVAICAAILVLGIVLMFSLSAMKSPPREVVKAERPLRVEVVPVELEDVPVLIGGHGEVKSLDVLTISPEVSGKIIAIHPRLEIGAIIPAGEVLFKIHPGDYNSAYEEEKAVVRRLESTILRFEKQQQLDSQRLGSFERNARLAKDEFERLRKLFAEDKVGTRSGVDAAEREFNSAYDQAYQLAQTIDLYPLQIREAQSNLAAARARMETARSRMERCQVLAPFSGRVKNVSLEVGQYVTPGQNLLTIANDSILEIHVPLDSRDVTNWLPFNAGQNQGKGAWFNSLDPVECSIRWTEDTENHTWVGKLHQVVKFDQQTRTLTVAVRVDNRPAPSPDAQVIPLVEGMFCVVKIPGRMMRQVFKAPRAAVSQDNLVFVSSGGRLKSVPVKVARVEGDLVYISSGLEPGDLVITTRLINPLENATLEIIKTAGKGTAS